MGTKHDTALLKEVEGLLHNNALGVESEEGSGSDPSSREST